MIEIKIENDTVTPALARLARSMANTAPVMTRIAGILHDAVEENFRRGGRPQWAGLKPPASKRRQGGQVLADGARLKNSIVERADATSAVVGTNVKYAAIHQFGGQTRAHEIRPRTKKAPASGGRVVRKVNQFGGQTRAPFLALTDGDSDKIVRTVTDYLRSLVK